MKVTCPNSCDSKCQRLITGIYYCNMCNKVFSINSEFLVIKDGDEPKILSTIPGITVPMKTLKHRKDYPYILVGIGEKGISKNLLSKKILGLNELSDTKKFSILKELDLEI